MQRAMGRLIAIIPARAGSVRLPGKNTKLVGGIPLVERSVQHAHEAGADLIVVTTDDENVRTALCSHSGLVWINRPCELASATASTDDVVHHVIDSLPIEPEATILILQPTSPFRDRSLLSACMASALDNPDALTVSVMRSAKVAAWARCMADDGNLADMPPLCDPVSPTGAVYAFSCGSFKARGTLESMSKVGVLSDPIHSCDIDEEHELVMAAALADAGFGDDVVDSTSSNPARLQ